MAVKHTEFARHLTSTVDRAIDVNIWYANRPFGGDIGHSIQLYFLVSLSRDEPEAALGQDRRVDRVAIFAGLQRQLAEDAATADALYPSDIWNAILIVSAPLRVCVE